MDGLKQRIVGALVLVSLAVIFVPMLFDEPHTERTTKTINLPEEPAFPSVDVPEPADQPAPVEEPPAFTLEEQQPVADKPQVMTGDEPTQRAEPKPEPVSEPQPVTATQQNSEPAPAPEPESAAGSGSADNEPAERASALEGGWLVQLGSFGNADNAARLRDKVREKGYASYTQSVERGDVSLTRVFSGPFASEEEARSAKSRLDQSFSLNSLVMEGDK